MNVQLVVGLTRRNYRRVLNRFTSQILSPGTNSLGKSQPAITKQSSNSYETYEGTERHPYPLTREETFAFLDDHLGIERPLECYRKDPETLLNRIAERMKKRVPFTTAHLFARRLNETSDIIGKYHIFSGHGGSCGTINPFTNALLKHIGYKTVQINGRSAGVGYISHVTTIACDVTFPGSRHLVEPGGRSPLLRAIPLDFETESPVYKCHHMYNKFFKRDGYLFWCAKTPQRVLSSLEEFKIMTSTEGDQWQILLEYELAEKNGRVVFNQYWQELARGEKGMPTGADTFIYTGFINDKFISILGKPEELAVTSFDEDGLVDKLKMTATELKSYFQKNYKTYSQPLLDKIIAANYKYIPHNVI